MAKSGKQKQKATTALKIAKKREASPTKSKQKSKGKK